MGSLHKKSEGRISTPELENLLRSMVSCPQRHKRFHINLVRDLLDARRSRDAALKELKTLQDKERLASRG